MKKSSRKKAGALGRSTSSSHEDALFTRVVDIIEAARGHVTRSVNTAMVQAYWLIGREIVEVEQHGEKRAGYGDEVIERLAQRLSGSVGQGFGARTLRRIRQFYVTYPNGSALPPELGGPAKRTAALSKSKREEIRSAALSKSSAGPAPFPPHLGWTHYLILLRVTNPAARAFYPLPDVPAHRRRAARRAGPRARGRGARAGPRRSHGAEGHSEEEAVRRARSNTTKAGAPTDLDAALAAISAEGLREIIHEVLLELDDRAHARVVGSLIVRAARTGAGFAPAAVSDEQVSAVLAFVKAAERIGQADPSEVDEYLRRGSAAFLRKDYASAHRIFGALLPPIGEGNIDLGQHELVDEVLGTDVAECAAQYVVSAFMLAPAAERPEAVLAAIDEVRGVGHFWEPLREMERVAIDPLPDLAAFLPRWRALIASKPAGKRTSDWDTEGDRWLREVVQRLEGAEGLAKVARTTKRADDLRAWCKCLVEAKNWPAALKAFGEAAELVTDKDYARGEFLDGAALTAQSLGRKDLPAYFERAWRASPSMSRLCRWLGSSSTTATLGKRVGEALEACPKQATRQQALLHVLSHDFVSAAKLLASGPGLGWSIGEHPGHLLFPLFARLLGGSRKPSRRELDPVFHRGADLDELEGMAADPEEPRLATPEVDALLALAGVASISDATSRRAVLAAMKKAAESRVAGVTEQKRRRRYGHAAELVATCVACDKPDETKRWAAALQAEYERFPALRDELERALRAP